MIRSFSNARELVILWLEVPKKARTKGNLGKLRGNLWKLRAISTGLHPQRLTKLVFLAPWHTIKLLDSTKEEQMTLLF